MGIISQTPVTLGGKTVLVDFMVIEDPLDFNMLLGRDYVYAMQAVVSTLFRVMYFNHGEEIVTIDQLDFLDPSPDPTRYQVFPLLIPSVSVDTTPPQVSYVASCPLRSIATKKQPLFSCLPSRDLVPTVEQVSHPIQTMECALHSVDPFESLDMCPISDDLLPSDEVFLESLIQSDLLLDVGSVVTKSNPDLSSKPDLSSYVGLVEFFTLPLNGKSVILMSLIFLMNFSTPMILSLFLQTLSPLFIFVLLLRLILLIIKP